MPSERIQEAINEIRAAEGASVTLGLSRAFNEEDDAKCIAEVIKEARVPLTLNLGENEIGDAGAKLLLEGIKEASLPLALHLRDNGIGEAGAKFLSEGIKAARVPLALDLRSNNIGEAGAKFLSEGIKAARVSLTLDLWSNNIGEAGAKFLSEGIKAARVPITLKLGANEIGDAGAQFLSEGIKAARFSITLNLWSNKIGDAGAKFLSEGIKEARVPLDLNLSVNSIGEAGAKFLSGGIKGARVPITLNLSDNRIGDAGAKFLSAGIKEARFPLTLDLRYNEIGKAGAKFFSEGIKEAQVPITLNLSDNRIGEAGAKFLSEGIKEARVLLTLSLWHNNIGDAGAHFLAEGIKEARVPLKLDCDVVKAQDNFIIDAGNVPSEFFAKLKFNLFNLLSLKPILTQTPVMQELLELNYPKDIALIIQDYDPNLNYLAWKAVAAIRAVEGASRDNEYASIDYDLLTAVYSTAPAASAVSALEEKAMEDNAQEARREAPVVISVEAAQSLNAKGIVYEKAGDIVRALHEGARLDIAGSLNNVGTAYELLWYIRLGLYYKEQGFKMMQSLYPVNHPAVIACLNNVAFGYEKLKELEEYSHYRGRADDVRQTIEHQERVGVFKGQGTLDYTDNSYPEYYNSGIDRVLELRLAGLTNAVSLKSRHFGNGLGYEAQVLASDVGAILSQGKQVVVPINLDNKHWVGLLFKGFGNRVEVTYMDPEQGTILLGLKSGLENGLSLNGYESQIEEVRLTSQSYNNCGYEVIENFMYYLTGTRATQVGAQYVQSLIVENSLLDPNVYGLKIEENNKLLGFLSSAEPIAINEIALFAEQGSKNKHERTVPNDRIAKLKTDLYKASVLFKTLDFAVDSARFAREPSMLSFKKLALDYACLKAMVSGVNSYSAMIAGAETLYQLQLGEYQKAFNVASTTMSVIALPAILAMANKPYLGIAYGAWTAASTAYGAITNAYSLATEFGSSDAALRSAMAYKDLVVTLAASPLQAVYDFEIKAKEYKLWINGLLFEKEKSIIQAQVKDEFGQKVFDYIYLPELIEKYVLLNDVIKGKFTEEEAQSLKSKPVAISYGELEYDACVRTEDSREEAAKHYYCCNIAEQILDHVVVTVGGSLEILESLY